MIDHEEQRQRQRRADHLAGLPALASNYGKPVTFGDEFSEQAHFSRCARIRRTMAGVEFQVAPMHVVTLPDGSLLREHAEITESMFCDAPMPAKAIVEHLVRTGVVLESLVYAPQDEGPQAA